MKETGLGSRPRPRRFHRPGPDQQVIPPVLELAGGRVDVVDLELDPRQKYR